MPTRTADHLFWMARYIERADKPAAGKTPCRAQRGVFGLDGAR